MRIVWPSGTGYPPKKMLQICEEGHMRSTDRSSSWLRASARANIFELQDLEIRRLLASASLGANNTLVILGSGDSETIEVNQLSNGLVAVTGDADRFTPGSGAQQFNKITIDGVGGNDLITIFGGVTYTAATIRGGSGNDFITGGSGADLIVGDGGIDGANYSGRPATSPLRISLDLAANDGRSTGEGDNVQTEEVFGGAGNDTITGSPGDDFINGGGGADSISGNGGNDEIVGSVGSDKLFGNEGDDALYAKNSDVDTVSGGTGPGTSDFDLAEVDSIDTSGGTSSIASTSTILARLSALQAALADDASVLDPTYSGDGLNSGPGFGWEEITAAAIDSQGRTILVGYADRDPAQTRFNLDFVAVRYNADGSFDNAFGGAGEASIDFSTRAPGSGYADDDFAYGVTTDADDNIIIVGRTENGENNGSDDFAVCRLDDTGALDTVFGLRRYDIVSGTVGGGNDDRARGVAIQADGKIVVVGSSNIESGAPDVAIIRLDASGSLDTGFNGGMGMNTFSLGVDQGVAVAVQPAGGIVVGGVSGSDFLLLRFTSAGALDTTFGTSAGHSLFSLGATSSDVLNDIAVHPTSGDIVAVGQSTDALASVGVLAGFTADGTIDATATHDGVSFNAVVADPLEGDFAVAGTSGGDFVVGRFASITGSEELFVTDFTPTGAANGWTDVALGVGTSADGKVTVGGYSSFPQGKTTLRQTSVARYDLVPGGGGVTGIEGFLSFEDVQNDPGANRSSTATFLLKSTHLDDNGNAFITLTDNPDVVNVTLEGSIVVVNINGQPALHYGTDTTSITIFCLNGADVVNVAPNVPVPMFVFGGNGTDSISGGSGADVLAGGVGNDTIIANGGFDILIGGAGSDSMVGGDGEDIFVGTTVFENNLAALRGLSAEWNSGNTRADRIHHIRTANSGGINGAFVLTVGPGGTISDDSAKDTYTGGNDLDWFFRRNSGGGGSRDVILDNLLGEEVTDF